MDPNDEVHPLVARIREVRAEYDANLAALRDMMPGERGIVDLRRKGRELAGRLRGLEEAASLVLSSEDMSEER